MANVKRADRPSRQRKDLGPHARVCFLTDYDCNIVQVLISIAEASSLLTDGQRVRVGELKAQVAELRQQFRDGSIRLKELEAQIKASAFWEGDMTNKSPWDDPEYVRRMAAKKAKGKRGKVKAKVK